MASLSNYISFLFLTTLLLPLQITARDSQFFSKVTHFDKNVKETELPNKEAPELNKSEQQPAFIPETENSYGLYGHDHDEPNHLPSTTTSYHPYKTQFEDTNKYYNNDAYNTRFAETGYNNNNNNEYYNKDAYGGNQYELSDTKYTEERYNSYQNNNNNNQKYYNNDAANGKFYYNNNNNYNANNNRYNTEKQGMSDTRFLDGGKYFYDISTEEKYNPTNYGDSSRGVNTNNNWYNNRGGTGTGNHNGYQNQEEFENGQENFEP